MWIHIIFPQLALFLFLLHFLTFYKEAVVELLPGFRVWVKQIKPTDPPSTSGTVLLAAEKLAPFSLQEFEPGPTDHGVIKPHRILGPCVTKALDGILDAAVDPDVCTVVVWLGPH